MNSLYTLFPYCKSGIWMFDDSNTGLQAEPFVGETNYVIDSMVLENGLDLDKAKDGVILMFGTTPFPGYQIELSLMETEPFGSTYYVEKYRLEPWLCPAFFKYFPEAPEVFYGAVTGYVNKIKCDRLVDVNTGESIEVTLSDSISKASLEQLRGAAWKSGRRFKLALEAYKDQ